MRAARAEHFRRWLRLSWRRGWFRFRAVVYLFYFFVGLSGTESVEASSFLPWEPGDGVWAIVIVVALALIAGFWAFGIWFMVCLQSVNPYSDDIWTRPTHASNPFRLTQPLPFAHLFAYSVFAAGTGAAISVLWRGAAALGNSLLCIIVWSATLVGMRLGVWSCAGKFSKATPLPTNRA